MANIETKLPKIEGVGVLADDATLATGIITLANGGSDVVDVKVSDIVNYSVDAYVAGTAEVNTIDFTSATLTANTMYSLSVSLPNVLNFFGGGQHATAGTSESNAVYTVRTYKVPTDATPTAAELAAKFAEAMQNDLYAPFTATVLGNVITITACDAVAGAFSVSVSNIPGTVVTVTTANVLPVGTPDEVKEYINPSLVTAATYDRHIIKYRKYIRHNAVKGLEVVKEEKLIIFSDTTDTLDATLVPMLDGSYIPVADYLGAPTA